MEYIIPIDEARESLRIDDDSMDEIIIPLLIAIPDYLEVATGRTWLDASVHPLAKTVAKFLLLLWFDTQTEDSERLRRTIQQLLTSLKLIGKNYDANS